LPFLPERPAAPGLPTAPALPGSPERNGQRSKEQAAVATSRRRKATGPCTCGRGVEKAPPQQRRRINRTRHRRSCAALDIAMP
jgi:hypothetical protein